MFWRMAGLSATSPVESVLDKETYTLEELFDEEEIIQECKSANSRLINFLRGKTQIQQMLCYIVEEPPEGADSRRAFKFPFVACEIFACEIEGIFKTLVEDEELMCLLFSFLDPDRLHSTLLAGYFSKVITCLMVKKTLPFIHYVEAHQEILARMVDLIGITSIMEALIRLVGADEHIYTNCIDDMQWLADTDLLEMLVDKLSSPNLPEVHTNAAETLCTITRLAPSALASKLSSPRFVGRLFHHALEDTQSKSTLVHSLSVCISVLDPKRAATVAAAGVARGHHITEAVMIANPETVDGMLQRLGDLLKLLDVSFDTNVLLTTYGELRPPLGRHRLKIVEFIAVLLRTGSEVAQQELVRLGAIQTIIQLFFDYSFNNSLHHQVESIIISCLESNNTTLIDHLFQDCKLVERFLAADGNPYISGDQNKPTVLISGKPPPKTGNIGHITRIANKFVQLGNSNPQIQAYLQANEEWTDWHKNVLMRRNSMENVNQWACGRPTTIQERTIDSDEDEFRDRDYDVSAMASNLTQAFRYGMFDNEDVEEVHGAIDRDDEDVFFDDESAEVVISSLRLGEEQNSGQLGGALFTNSNWFAFPDDRSSERSMPTSIVSSSQRIDDSPPNNTMTSANSGSSSSDDEVVVGEDEELIDTATSHVSATGFDMEFENGMPQNGVDIGLKRNPSPNAVGDLSLELEKVSISDDLSFFQCEERSMDLFSVKPPDWVGWRETEDFEGTSGRNPFNQNNPFEMDMRNPGETGDISNSAPPDPALGLKMDDGSCKEAIVEGPNSGLSAAEEADGLRGRTTFSLFEENVEFVGVEVEGTAKAMEHALKEGTVGEATPIKRNEAGLHSKVDTKTIDGKGDPEYNDVNYWRSEYDLTVARDESL